MWWPWWLLVIYGPGILFGAIIFMMADREIRRIFPDYGHDDKHPPA